jgi:hypothetical protein
VIEKIWQENSELYDMDLRVWLEKINMIGVNWTKQDIIDVVFML